ncbi:MAG: nuclear transport factor 2 family protein [Litorilituus sp.]|jgi:hypothetical protein|nr:nuclear transport factor 2 family protein [Litorilituus sp.]
MTKVLVKQKVQEYIDACFIGDAEKLKSLFHESAVMSGYFNGQFMFGDITPFIENIAQTPPMKETEVDYHASIEKIDVAGKVASVVLVEKGFFGVMNFVNYLHLIEVNNEWKVSSKNFTSEVNQ